MTLGLNVRAAQIADCMETNATALRVCVTRLTGGVRFIDCGIEAQGGLEAGRLLAEACMGGAGHVSFSGFDCDGLSLPGVTVHTDHPALACLASQYAGWAIKPEGYFAMGSGPLRAVARVEEALFERLGYAEPADGPGVLVLETRQVPGPEALSWIQARSGVAAERLTILAAPTATPAAGVQISARVVETALHKLHELAFDVTQVLTAFGTAPIAHTSKNDVRAIGRTNDCVLYGGFVHLTVAGDDAQLEALVPRVPSSASRDYGTPFYDVFRRYDGDFYKVDPMLFSPARVAVTNTRSGRTFEAGRLNATVLKQSLLS
ncbi:MAG TPA: methenyltetrahydromethanopterin cyclohydrolase [Vicinamibacteria bacterium]|nr:methenyltetrahydromethanopterin cyclohydrolase [Vicinamibacteria bacterium]